MIDDNCHPLHLVRTPLRMEDMSLDVALDSDHDARRRRVGPWRVAQERLTTRLSARFECDPDEVLQARETASADWSAYTQQLFADADLTDLVMDVSYPPGAEDLTLDFSRLSGCRVHPILRFESVIDPAIAAGQGAAEIMGLLQTAMYRWAENGCAGFKSFIAYRTGLAIDPGASVQDAEASLTPELPVRRRGSACRNWLLRRALGIAAELNLPVHVHAGLGDSDLRMGEANPLLLEPLLDTVEGSAARIVIIHGAYPFEEELGHLATVRSNVWADLSMSNLFSPATLANRMIRIVDLVPANKLLFGTDGHDQPEIFWHGARTLREGWQEASRRLREAGARQGWLTLAEERIFGENARYVYGLLTPTPA